MSTPKPPPWALRIDTEDKSVVIEDVGGPIATLHPTMFSSVDELHATANLICSSHYLLQCCKRCLDVMVTLGHSPDITSMLYGAINRATGSHSRLTRKEAATLRIEILKFYYPNLELLYSLPNDSDMEPTEWWSWIASTSTDNLISYACSLERGSERGDGDAILTEEGKDEESTTDS